MTTQNERERDPAEDSDWVTVETRVSGAIAVEVRRKDNYVTNNPPLYSLRVGRARLAAEGTMWISPHMSIYDLHVACELIEELGEKYRGLRLQQSNRRVIEKRTPRLGLSRDGVLEARPSQPQRVTNNRYYAGNRDEGDDE